MILCYIGRMQFGQDSYFLNNVFDFVFGVFDIDYFDCYCLAGTLVDPGTYELANADLCCWMFFITHPLYTFPKLPPPMSYQQVSSGLNVCCMSYRCNPAWYRWFLGPATRSCHSSCFPVTAATAVLKRTSRYVL